METVAIVLNIGQDLAEQFEKGFREHELPIWEDFAGRGVMPHSSLTKMGISTQLVKGAVQYQISVTFTDGEGHHLHDEDPRFQAWNKMAEAFHVAAPIATGGEFIISAGETT